MSPAHIPARLTILAAALSALVSAHAQQSADPAAAAVVVAQKATKPAASKANSKIDQPAAKPAAKPADIKSESEIQKVEVRGSADAYNARRDDTASKMVVNHEEIIKYGDTSVVDVLKRLPGVTVGGARGSGDIRMRGLGAGYTQILVNGERPPSGFSLENLAPELIERIEVMRAASAEFSTQSIAGTINVVLKKSVAAKLQREIKSGLGLAPHSYNPTLNLQMSDQVGKMSYSLTGNLSYNEYENAASSLDEAFDGAGKRTRLRQGNGINKGRNTNIGIGPRLSWTLEGGDTLTLQNFLNMNRYGRLWAGKTSFLPGDTLPYPDNKAHGDGQFVNVYNSLNWVHKGADGSKLDLKFTAGWSANDNDTRNIGFLQSGAQGYDTEYINKGHGVSLASTGKYSTPMWEGHALSVGWDGGLNTQHDDTRVLGEVAGLGAKPTDSHNVFAARISRLALFAQDEWNLTPLWSLYLGGRWEGIQTSTEGDSFTGATSRTSVFSPLMQTLYKLPGGKGDQLRFAVTRTYKAPQPWRLNPRRRLSDNNSQSDPDYGGNPGLKPELALGLDASYEHYWTEGALISVSVSSRRIDNYMRDDITLDGTRYVFMPLNVGHAQTRGIELEAKFPLKAIVANAPAIDLRMSVSRNWSSVDAVPGPDNRLSEQTPLSATLGVEYKQGALMAGGTFAFRNGGPVRVSADHITSQSVRRDLDTYVLWKFDPKNQVRLALNNMLGQRGINEQIYFPGVGLIHQRNEFGSSRNLRVTLENKF
ncbi:MAG: TonB-dependent receptor [Massilia sp.]